MWVCSKYGFFSTVVDKRDSKKLVVRTRDKRHLTNLMKRYPREFRGAEIEVNQGTDYPFRIIIAPNDWAYIMYSVAHNVDYTNFKIEAENHVKTVGKPYVKALHKIWEVLFHSGR